jgi:DNA-binding MarR family transcriptional regulator
MISKTILFYWSKGADTRRKIIRFIYKCEKKNKPCFLNSLAKKFNLTHVAIKKHIDLLIEEKFIESINPSGKPVYLKLTNSGKEIVKELTKKL